MENIKKAKELFFHYNGSFFNMDREGDYKEYSKFNIDKETEKIWMEELIQLKLKQYKKTSDFRYLYFLTDNNRYDLFDKIMEVEVTGTSLNRIVVMELLVEFLCKNKKIINNYEIYKDKIIEYYNQIKQKKIRNEHNERLNKIKEKLNVMKTKE
jgi:hypothetical protein